MSTTVEAFVCPACHDLIPCPGEVFATAVWAHMHDIHDIMVIEAVECPGCKALHPDRVDAGDCCGIPVPGA